MANETLNFTINLNGNAYKGILQIDDSLKGVLNSVDSARSAFKKLGDASVRFDSIVNTIGKVSDGFKFLAGDSLKFEQTQLNLQTLLGGSAEAADELVGKLREYGKNTVYDFNGLAEAQKTMMSFGIESDKAFSVLQNIGDIAMGDNQKMQSLALAFSQATSTGKLMGQDFNQMINAGFNPLQVISERTGESMESLKKKMGDGAISSDMLAQAFQWATEEGGLFYEGAERAADSVGGRIAKMKDTVEEWKLSLFEATGGATAYIAEIGEMITPLSQLYPVLEGIKSVGGGVVKTFGNIKTKIYNAYTTLGMYNGYLSVGKVQNLGFRKNVLQSAVALARFATVGVWNAVKGLGAYILSLVTSGSMSVKFSGIASGAFKAFSLAAKTAIASIPIIGWVALGITAVASLVSYLWNKFDAVGEFLSGMGGRIMSCFLPCLSIIISFKRYWQSIKDAFTEGGIIEGIKRIGFVILDAILAPMQGFLEMIEGVTGLKIAGKGVEWIAGLRERLETSTRVEKKKEEKPKGNGDETEIETPETPEENNPTGSTLSTVGNNSESSGKVRSITVNVEKLVERFEIHTTNMQGDMSRVKDMVSEALLSALNDVNLAM